MKKLKGLRKIVAIMLAGAITLSTPGNNLFNNSRDVKAESEWTATTLVSNGDFESCDDSIAGWEITGWLTNNGLWYLNNSEDSYANNNTTFIKTNNSSDEASTLTMSQTISDVAAGTYKVAIRSTGSSDVVSGISISISDGENIKAKSLESVSSWGTWITTETDAITLTESGSLTISIYGDVASGYYGYIDDVVIYKENSDSGNVDSNGSLVNGDFSTSDSGWTINDTDKVKYETTDDTNNGTQALKFNNWGAGTDTHIKVSQTIDNFAAGEYQLKYNISGEVSTVFPFISTVSYGTDSKISSLEVSTTGWGNWVNVSTPKFTVAEGDSITITFEGDMSDGYWGWLDDVSLEPYVAPTRSIPIDTTATVASPVESDLYVEKVNLFDGFMTGFDISSYRSIKNSEATYKYADGTEIESDADFFALLKNSGVNYVRIRVWVDPYDENKKTYGGGCNDLEIAKDLGKLATEAGMRVLIDFHYSDF
ncbi:MAG: glycosyl hydrolase 53 family protein [Lachnospiraceae bacterium]|nr:glycosyl hydrolase 53 family protein [Lachnospiraceae bacterium]